MASLVVVVPRSRGYCGRATMLGSDGTVLCGPFRALATASERVARKHGNPDCDVLLAFGHTPAGSYRVAGTLPPWFTHPRRPRRFGAVGALLLLPTAGDALVALSRGRELFAIHGGPVDTANRLRPTRGGIRMSDRDVLAVMKATNASQARGDPLASIELIEVGDEDIRNVPPIDLRGARRALGSRTGDGRSPTGGASTHAMLFLALGATGTSSTRALDRRAFLQAALLLVGGLTSGGCSQSSPLPPNQNDPACTTSCRHRGDGDGGGASKGGSTDCDAGDMVTNCSNSGGYGVGGGYG